MSKLNISIIIPVFNEEENLKVLLDSLIDILAKLDKTYEIIFIDDGSVDNSFEVLKELKEKNSNIKIIRFRRNFGQTSAIQAGFDYASGEIIITLDADLQNSPEDIPKLIDKIEQGYDVVSGWRKKRKDAFLSRKLPSFFANLLISFLTGVKLHDYGCTLKAYRKEVIKDLSLYGEMHRFIPALAYMNGAKITEIEVSHKKRKYGSSKYNLTRTIRVILDLITVKFFLSFLTSPMQIFGLLGIVSFLLGFLLGCYLIIAGFIFHQEIIFVRGWLILSAVLLLMGIQLIVLGLLGELISRIYQESRRKPIYVIKEVIK